MLRRKWKPFKKNYRSNKTVFLPYNSPVRQFSVRISRKTYTANSRRKEKPHFMSIECIRSPTVLVSSFTLRASAVYLQRGHKLDRGAQDWNARGLSINMSFLYLMCGKSKTSTLRAGSVFSAPFNPKIIYWACSQAKGKLPNQCMSYQASSVVHRLTLFSILLSF